jgi:hypothetical protein
VFDQADAGARGGEQGGPPEYILLNLACPCRGVTLRCGPDRWPPRLRNPWSLAALRLPGYAANSTSTALPSCKSG